MECHVSAGIGVIASAMLAGRTKGAVSQWRKNHGLKTAVAPSPRWLSLEERTKRAQEEAFVREQKAWLKSDRAVCWTKHSEYTRALALFAYYNDHEQNKKRARINSRKTWHKQRENVLWRERRQKLAREYRAKHPERCKDRNRKWRSNNPDKWKECKLRVRERQKADPAWRAMRNVRERVRGVLYGKRSARATVGCSREEFMQHIESKFTNGMQWNNYGTYWHVDHIVPVSHFDLSDLYHAKMVNHWTNLQPLEAEKNLKKSNRIHDSIQCYLPL
jgi:hypothetical protein